MNRMLDLGLVARDAASMRLASGDGSRQVARDRLLSRLRNMHGLPHKVAQLLTIGEVAQEDFSIGPVAPQRQPIPFERVQQILRAELGDDGASRIAALEPTATPASIGQVHRGRLSDGTRVAVKIQYPGVRSSIEADLAALGWLARPFGNMRRDFSLDAYRAEMREMLLAETDYTIEAETLRRFSRRIEDWRGVVIPKPVKGLCSRGVLTMTWIDGDPVGSCRTWPQHERAFAARQLLRFFLASILEWNEIYADAHPGNFRFRRTDDDPAIGILDFGCMRVLDGPNAFAISALIDAVACNRLQEYSPDDLAGMYFDAGFDFDRIEPMKDRLAALTRLLFEPFASAAPFDPAQWDLGNRSAEILGPYRLAFRTAGPPALLAFIRAYYGLIQHLVALDVPISWAEVRARINTPNETAPRPAVRLADPIGPDTKLRIRVAEGGRIKADVTMRGAVAGRLEEIVPDNVLESVRARGVDLRVLSQRAIDSAFSPQALFESHDGQKTMSVWLE